MIKRLSLKFFLSGLLGLSLLHSQAQTVTVSTFAGSSFADNTDGAIGTPASFNKPIGVAVDGSGNMYVTDNLNHQIRKISSAGVVTTFAGSGTAGSANGVGTAASFNNPTGIAVDGSGNVYVADRGNNKIRKITSAGVVTTFAGSGNWGSIDATGTAASFNGPEGVAVDGSGNVYVADYYNCKIRKITSAGVVTTVAGIGNVGSTDGTKLVASFYYPSGVALDASGNIYVADKGNNKIRKVTPDGVVSTFAGSGTSGNINGTGTAAQFQEPRGIAVDGSGNFYVSGSSYIIRKITPAGVVSSLAGGGSVGSDNSVGPQASFNNPHGLAVDASGNIYVADADNNKIRKITPDALVTTFAGNGTAGSTNGNATVGAFVFPTGLATDANGNVYVADHNSNQIRKITAAGVVTTLAGSGAWGDSEGTATQASFEYPIDVALDASGNVYVADYNNNKIRKVTPAGVVTTFAGSGIVGSSDGTGTSARFYYPSGVAVDGSGNVYVADKFNNKIRKITSAGVVTTLAGSGSAGSADGVGTAASFNRPSGIAVDGSGNVYVADQDNNIIRKITPAGVVTTLAGSYLSGSTDGTGTSARFTSPSGVAVDGSGNLYVADQGNHKIRKITPTGEVTTLAGIGTEGSTDGTGAEASFKFPSDVALDGSGNLYVADRNNYKIRKLTNVTTGVFSGQEYSLLSLYPNPTQSELHIDVEGTKNIRIVDPMGRVVMEQEINTNVLSVAHLPKGIYAVVVEQKDKKYVSRLAKE